MKIMKMWRNTTLFAYFRFMGYVMMIVGIYLIVNGGLRLCRPIPSEGLDSP